MSLTPLCSGFLQEGMEDWDQEQLELVVANKHGNERPENATEIICKFFLDAVERRMYGWCALETTYFHF